MTSSSPARPIRIETLTPQIHGFIRAYVWQVYRGADPVIDDDPAQQTALLVARAICRLIGRDREMLRRLTQELGSYMGAMNPRKYAPSDAFKKLIAEFGGDQTDELPVISDAEPAAAPAFEQALAEPAPVQDAPAAPAPVEVEVPTHVPAPVIEPAAAPAIEVAPAEPVSAPTHDEPAAPPADAPADAPVAVVAEPAVEPVAEAVAEAVTAPSAESPNSDGKRRRKGKKSKGDSGEVVVPAEAAAEAAPSEAASSDADASTKAGGEQSDETTNS